MAKLRRACQTQSSACSPIGDAGLGFCTIESPVLRNVAVFSREFCKRLSRSRIQFTFFRWIATHSASRAQGAPRFSTCVRLSDYAGPVRDSRYRPPLPVASTRSPPSIRFSKLDSLPADAPVYTSPGTSRHPAQDSGSRWFATPFSWGSFIPHCTPVYPDVCTCSRARLRAGVRNRTGTAGSGQSRLHVSSPMPRSPEVVA